MKSSIYRQLFLCLILTWIESFRATPVCQSSLGMEDGSIADIQLSASSAHSGLSDALSGRLNSNKGYGAWCPNQGTGWYSERNGGPYHNQYFQVFLNKPMRISAVGTQGRSKDYGMEGVESFYVNYTLMASGLKPWTQYRDWMQTKAKEFEGNTNNLNVTKMSFFKPPIIADNFRLIPILYPVNQVCLRMELYGCQITQDLLSYTMNPGNTFETSYNLTDVVFDGVITPSKLISGLGFLTDGVLAPENFITHNGYGWIGWHSKETRSPFIELDFLKRRVFKTVTFHSNIRTRSGIQLFKAVKIEFFDENVNPHAHVTHYTKDVSSGYTWMNYNVTVDMCLNYAKSLKMRFTYSGEWMLISEVTVDSDSVIGNRLPTPECATEPPVIVISTVADENTTTNNLTLPGSLPDSSSGLDAGAIIGIACGVVLILILLVLFLCCWCYRRKRHHQKKPSFYHFIRWELKPYPSGYRTAVRVSRLGSEEEKNYTFRRQPAESGEDRLEGQVPGMYGAGPIYASIENPDEIGKAAGLSPTTSMSPTKGGKPKNKPPPLPLHSIQGPTDAHYALPDSPISNYHSPIDNSEMISHEALSPEHHTKTLQPSPLPPQPDVIPTPDVFYAEPDTPAPPKTKAGYCEPIDAVIPGDGVFPNPVYEEIYAEPYQGVSGTSLYANPTTDLKIKHDNFKEFPREKLIFREKIGDGQFGEVHLGEAEDLGEILDEEFSSNRKVLVAIKVLKPDVDKNIKSDFFKEVKIMAGIQHENVIRLLGVCKDDPMCMIVEYMVNGDLNQFLKERELAPGKGTNKEKVLTYQALIYMASQIAAGMKYIASLKFVHRDLATRNCLVGHSYTVKIADFGMSRHLYSKHYYRVQGRVILPIRWMAPECILQGKFTSESDVWAFAVTLWEILTLAAKYPYDELTDEQVIENIQRMFFRPNDPNLVYLERPSVCPSDVYDMMKSCWQKDPNKRPVFKALHDFLKKRVRLSEMAI